MEMPSTAPRLAEPSPVTDAPDVLRDLAQGNMDALAAVYRRHSPAVHRLAVALTLSADDADDVVQEVFIGLPEAMQRYVEQGAFEAWLMRITARVALRKVRVDLRNAGDEPLRFTPARSDAVIDRITLEQALRALSPDARVIVVLKLVAGYSHDEIATHLGARRNTIEVRLHRAIAKLRALLSPDPEALP
jgi:RNA polymerase sigma factor (sigma-70 family)